MDLLKISATEKKVNIVAALKTDGLNPVIIAYTQTKKIKTICWNILNLWDIFKNLKRLEISKKTIPTCKPDTARTCIAPVLEKTPFTNWFNSSLYPKVSAEAIANSLDLSPLSENDCRHLFLTIVENLFKVQEEPIKVQLVTNAEYSICLDWRYLE